MALTVAQAKKREKLDNDFFEKAAVVNTAWDMLNQYSQSFKPGPTGDHLLDKANDAFKDFKTWAESIREEDPAIYKAAEKYMTQMDEDLKKFKPQQSPAPVRHMIGW